MAIEYLTIMEWHGDKYIEAIDRMVYDALWQVGGDLQTASVNECPVDTGALRRSCAYKIDKNGARMELTIGYGADIPYAWKQHETPWFDHSPPVHKGGKWKFLEDPFNARRPVYVQHLKDVVRRWANGGGVR